MIAVPPSGPFCPGDCIYYPFEELLNYYPRDYYWMYLAIFQLIVFVIFIVSIHLSTLSDKKIFSSLGVSFGLISALILLIDYYVQFSVIPISVSKNETDGIAILTQYNDHGIFIALEELGYLLMSLALFFIAFIKSGNKILRWVFLLPFYLNLIVFAYISIKFGIERSYRFEVITISLNWLSLIIGGILMSIHMKKDLSKFQDPDG